MTRKFPGVVMILNLNDLPPEIFDYILFLIGQDSLESLYACRRVCSAWNEKIKKCLWEKPNKQWGPIIVRRIERSLNLPFEDMKFPSNENIAKLFKLEADGILPVPAAAVMKNFVQNVRGRGLFTIHPRYLKERDLQAIRCAACLADKGILGSVDELCLWDADLSFIPAQHLSALTSSVMKAVSIDNVRGCDIVNILENVKCPKLHTIRQRFGSVETSALVQAMESRVEHVVMEIFVMQNDESLPLDIAALTKYSGLGKCKKLWMVCNYESKDSNYTYWNGIWDWAKGKDWNVQRRVTSYSGLGTKRKQCWKQEIIVMNF